MIRVPVFEHGFFLPVTPACDTASAEDKEEQKSDKEAADNNEHSFHIESSVSYQAVWVSVGFVVIML